MAALMHFRVLCARARSPGGARAMALLLLVFVPCLEARAAAFGSLATSVGPFAALAALFAVKGAAAHGPASSLLAACCALGAGAGVGATWLLCTRAAGLARPPVAQLGAGSAILLPPDVEAGRLLGEMRSRFIAMQSAWDLGDVPAMRALATPEMIDELLMERGRCVDPAAPPTSRSEVLTLEVTLIGFDETPQARIASVEFSGLMRESGAQGPVPFRELWMLVQPSGERQAWRLARHHALL